MVSYSETVFRLGIVTTLAAGLFTFRATAQAEVERNLILNPYAGVNWNTTLRHKANFHTHTTESDGGMDPGRVIDEYHERGYGVLAITDHDRCTFPWSRFGRDPGVLGMVDVPANELSRHHHTLGLFCEFSTGERDHDTVLKAVGDAGGLAVLCHPAMHWPRQFSVPSPALAVPIKPALRKITQADFTIEVEFRTTASGRNILMGNYASDTGGRLNLELHTSNRIRVWVQPREGRTVDMRISGDELGIDTRDGKWHHLAAVREGAEVRLYLDGRLALTGPDTAGAYDLVGNTYFLGRDSRTGSTILDGGLDNVRLWSRALTGDELAAIARGQEPHRNRLLAEYRFGTRDAESAMLRGTITGPISDTGGHPEGPFDALPTPGGGPRIGYERGRVFVRFGMEPGDDANGSVPAEVVAWYAGFYKRHPHLIGIEVLNGTRPLNEVPLDRALWDGLLSTLMPNRPVWGFAVDDMHQLHQLGRDWVTVLTPRHTEEDTRTACRQGAFYMNSIRLHPVDRQSVENVPAIVDISHDARDGTITIIASDGGKPLSDDSIVWIANGKLIKVGPTLAYRKNEGISAYVRAELKGRGGIALTNPFGFSQSYKSVQNKSDPSEKGIAELRSTF
jgi:hypothetical protein